MRKSRERVIKRQYRCSGSHGRRNGHVIVFHIVVDDFHERVVSLAADVAEIVHVQRPGHGPAVTTCADEIHLDFQRIGVFVADPLFLCFQNYKLANHFDGG